MCGMKSIPAGIFSSLSWMLGKSIEISPIEPVLNVMPGFSKYTKESWWNMERDLFALLLKFCSNEATELRDKIYAFLGIASDTRNGNFEASYEVSEEELVQDVVSFLSFGVKIDRSLFSAPRWTLHDFFKNLTFLPFIVSDGVN
ncbi:hypothetical protein P152DRAFT_17218 [Eremomyces bilateralis CBS 781.70]|uniref:Uncharacterized protein n=1 Tax=Eremomyces bilateralis CBS 781.70 TaxID=1392243 RepID=A0A6G1GHM8_9PEZI|nr:uncharacterized protein P152DRAFT_17218 [Eremomyces bilateralis CBS 781.70]KAF1817379.1 hypothetical protein P152DRAFT_17218 [Eremomyces bilateralis CBS 781.70]